MASINASTGRSKAMPIVNLPGRALIVVSGADAEHLLQNIVTTDLDSLEAGVARPGALLTPQGKIMFDFLISRQAGDAFFLECRRDVADDFMNRLLLYRLRAKVEFRKQEPELIEISWDADSSTSDIDSSSSESESSGGLRDLRFLSGVEVRRSHGDPRPPTRGVADWDALRIAAGVAESGADYELGEAFPHDVLLDQNGGVGFTKGCYVGQEVVSRMQHRGSARRRILIAEADAPLPGRGTPVMAGDRPAGEIGTVRGQQGLALVRIDRVKDAMDGGLPITAGDIPVRLSIPPGAGFTFPRNEASEGEA
jgi:tRNA-modifying protein YgfZ